MQKKFLNLISKLFYRHGEFVSLHPEWTIVACIILTLLSCIGLINFQKTSDRVMVWIPESSVSLLL